MVVLWPAQNEDALSTWNRKWIKLFLKKVLD